jgi:hypothetical protein
LAKIRQHHQAWLDGHPDRSVEWLKSMFKHGFDIHHMDGNHLNNDLHNLVLIEHVDHMRLHDIKHWNRLVKRPLKDCVRNPKIKPTIIPKIKPIIDQPLKYAKRKKNMSITEWLYPKGYFEGKRLDDYK